MKTIFFSFSITNSSLTDYFITACNKIAQDYRVVIITDRIGEHPFAISPHIAVLQWPSARPTTVKSFVFLVRLILKHRPVTMISMFGSMNIFLLTGFLLRVQNRIAWNHSIYAKTANDAGRIRRKKAIYKMATHIFTNSNASRRDLEDHFDVKPDKITVVYNAVRAMPREDAAYDLNRIVFFGRFNPAKGLDTLLAAMPEIVARFPQIKLTLYGAPTDGNAAEKYRQIARKLHVSDSVEMGGNLAPKDVVKALLSANCCIVPSFLEAFGFVVIESFSVGTPVAGSNSSGIAEIIRDGRDGLLFETGNPVDLAKKVIAIVGDKAFRDACATQCYQRFRDTFEIEKVTNELRVKIREVSR